MPVSIGPRIGVQGADEFRQAFRLMAQEAKQFKTELDLVKASFTANDTAMDRSKAVMESLNKQLDQNKRVMQSAIDTRDKAKEAVDKATDAYEKEKQKLKEIPALVEKNAKAVADATEKYNNQKKATDKVQESYDKLKKNYDDASKKVEDQASKVKFLRGEYKQQIEEIKKLSTEQGKNSEEVKKARTEHKELAERLTKEKNELNNLKEAQRNAKDELNKATPVLKDHTKALTESERELNKAIKANKDENELIAEQEKRIQNASTRLYEAQNVLSQYEEKITEVATDQKELNKALEETPDKLQITAQTMQGLGGMFEEIGTKLSTYVTAPLAALGTYGVKNASNLTDGMAKIYTIATETQEPMADMRQGLIDLSDASGFALDDLTEAAYQAVSASVDAGDAVAFMGDATRLARAGFTTTTKSVDLLTTIMNAYGKETYDAAYLSDLLLRTQNDGKTIVDDLAGSMGVVIPTAAAYGVGIEQVAAAYATMTKQGVNTARATTMLNALFTELEKPDKDAAILLEEITGHSFAQLMQEGMSLGEVLGILYNNLDQDTEAFANLFKNIRSGRAANALMAQDSAVLNYELERMSDVTGQTDYALEMLETPSLKARKALNKLKNSTVDLGETLIEQAYPIFEKLVSIIDDFRGWIKSLNGEQKKSIARWLELIAVVGPALKIGGTLLTTVGGAVDLFAKMKKATAGATSAGKALSAIVNAEELGFSALTASVGYTALGIIGVTAAVGGLTLAAKASADQYRTAITNAYGLREAERTLIDSTTQLHDSTMQMNTASKEEADAINVNAEKAQVLAERYNWLMDNTTMTAESKQKLADTYLTQLAEAMGMELEDVQALIDENGKLSASIDEVIQKKRASALLKAYEDDYAEALKNRSQAEKEVTQLTTQLQYTNDRLSSATQNLTYWQNRANEEARTGIGISEETQKHLDEAVVAHSAANQAYNETAEALANANESYQTIMSTIEGFEGTSTALATGSAYEIEAALIKMTEGFVTAERGTKESLENQVKNAKENLAKVQAEFDRGADGITQEMLDAYMKIYTDSEAELSKWEQMNGKKLDDFVDDISQKKEPVRQATQNTVGQVPKEADKQMKKVPGTADTGMNDFIQALKGKQSEVKQAAQTVVTAATHEFEGLYGKMVQVGYNFTQGFVDGIGKVNVSQPASTQAKRAVDAARYQLSEKSPSKVMEEVGEYFTLGFVKGINNENATARQAARAMAQSAVNGSWMTSNYTPTGFGYTSAMGGTGNTRNITAPISVNVNVNGNVDDVDQLASAVAERINDQIIRRNEVFA